MVFHFYTCSSECKDLKNASRAEMLSAVYRCRQGITCRTPSGELVRAASCKWVCAISSWSNSFLCCEGKVGKFLWGFETEASILPCHYPGVCSNFCPVGGPPPPWDCTGVTEWLWIGIEFILTIYLKKSVNLFLSLMNQCDSEGTLGLGVLT